MFKNFGMPSAYQWKRIALNAALYFVGTLVGLLGFSASQGVAVNVVDLSVSTFISAIAAAGGSTIKFVWTLLFEPSVK